jgi:hypothetical protein
LWDISVPVSKPEVEAGHGTLDEADKRRKGYVEGERLCLFGGYAGHVEAVLSIVSLASSSAYSFPDFRLYFRTTGYTSISTLAGFRWW